MGKKVFLALFLLVALFSTFLRILYATPVENSPTEIVVPDDYLKVQWAVGNASYGDTVFVKAGTYYEHVVVNKTLSLVGENRSATIIDGSYLGTVVKIAANNVKITGFTIQKSGIFPNNGIYVEGCTGINISHNNVIDNGEAGIHLVSSNNTVVSGNIISSNVDFGLYVEDSENNVVSDNVVLNNWCGIRLEHSSKNTILRNNVSDNVRGAFPFVSSYNNFFHNNFFENSRQVFNHESMNFWDNGDSSGGNYWSDYTGADYYGGPYQNITGGDGLGDTPYIIDDYNLDNYPLMNPWTPPPNLAIKNVTLSKTVIGQGRNLLIAITVQNQGNYIGAFNLTVYANMTTIHTLTDIAMSNGNSLNITVAWNTTGFAKGEYTLNAYAWPVQGERDTADNTWVGSVVVSVLGDVNGDFADDIYDIVIVATAFGSESGDENWNANADLNDDSFVDIYDAVTVAKNFGK